MFSPPVDLSFHNIILLSDVLEEEPRAGLRPLRRTRDHRYDTRSMKLNNNTICDLRGLHTALRHFLSQPQRLAWLDLSFNNLSHIEEVLCELHELRVLYLHGNIISELEEVNKLSVLPWLYSITLHGNHIEQKKAYRGYVISMLPMLKKMDFSAVTPDEWRLAQIWRESMGSSSMNKDK